MLAVDIHFRSSVMNDRTVHVLNDLLEVTKDGEEGFERAAAEVEDHTVREALAQCASNCRIGAQELASQVRRLGGEPDYDGSPTGALHRGWMNLKAMISGHDTTAVLNECERGEDYAKGRYRRALEEDLPADIRMLIQDQYRGVLANHDRVKALRDQYAHH
jgi:uncharacterized protein (TIGR02284 family)